MKVILDTNVVVSAILRGRDPVTVLLFVAEHSDVEWIASPEILAEYKDVLERPKFDLSRELVRQWLDLIHSATTISMATEPVDFPRDRKDAKFLACALASDADFLVTGDSDFEEAKLLGNTKIVSVSQFKSLIMEA